MENMKIHKIDIDTIMVTHEVKRVVSKYIVEKEIAELESQLTERKGMLAEFGKSPVS